MSSRLPLFPLNAVLVPGLVLPLHIFEPRYREMVEDLLEIPDPDAREFGIVGVREGRSVERDGMDALWPVGTAAVLRQAERRDDGRFDIVTTGTRRFRLRGVDDSAPLVRASVDFLDDPVGPDDEALAARATSRFVAYREALSGQVDADEAADAEERSDDAPTDPTVLSYLITAAIIVSADERQALLAAPTTAARLSLAIDVLGRETGIIAALGCLPAIELPAAPGSVN